jgi:hypothetical protein
MHKKCPLKSVLHKTDLRKLTCIVAVVRNFKLILPSLHIRLPRDVESVGKRLEIFDDW